MPTQTLIAFAVFFTLLGACIGSFLNVVIWRLPHRGREVLYLEKHGKLALSWLCVRLSLPRPHFRFRLCLKTQKRCL